MGSALRRRGGTRLWRRIRRRILERDRHVCQFPVGDRQVCGAAATDCGHIISRHEWRRRWPGRPGVDADDNLRAECVRHNRRAGALLRNGKPADTPRVPTFRSEQWQ
jgi:5-methylcytosine-specific restriction endonuclease McrA